MSIENEVSANLADMTLHRSRYRIPIDERDPLCGACHVVTLPAALSASGTERFIADHYLSFLDSPYAHAGLKCSSCHQQLFVNYDDGYQSTGHRYLGSGSALPYSNGNDDSPMRTISMNYLAGLGDISMDIGAEDMPPCIGDIGKYFDKTVEHFEQGRQSPLKEKSLQRERGPSNPFRGSNGGTTRRDMLRTELAVGAIERNRATLKVSTTNWCVGHTFPSGGGIKGYLDVTAYDGSGQVVGRYGGLGPDGLPVELPTNLGVRSVDRDGKLIADRRYWNAVKRVYLRTIRPGEIQTDTIELPITGGSALRSIVARWYYLRPEYFRSRERGITRTIPPALFGQASWKAGQK